MLCRNVGGIYFTLVFWVPNRVFSAHFLAIGGSLGCTNWCSLRSRTRARRQWDHLQTPDTKHGYNFTLQLVGTSVTYYLLHLLTTYFSDPDRQSQCFEKPQVTDDKVLELFEGFQRCFRGLSHCNSPPIKQLKPMAPSLTSEALSSTLNTQESTQTQSPPSSCGSDDGRQEELEHMGVADTVLNDDNWIWLRELLDPVRDAAVRSQGKVFFARLFKASASVEMETTLSEMENWRETLGNESERPREHQLVRALFLLGYDKNMSMTR